MESDYTLISLVIAAILLVYVTVAAVVALRRGDGFGKTANTWGRRLLDIVFGIG